MEDNYEGIPLSPGAVGPISFELQNMQGGVTPSDTIMDSQPLPPPPPPPPPPPQPSGHLPPIGFEAHVPPPINEVPSALRVSGNLNKGYQSDSNIAPGREDDKTNVSILSIKPLPTAEQSETEPDLPPPPDAVQVLIQEEEHTSDKEKHDDKPDLFMDDGVRRVDYVLVYVVDPDEEDERQKEIWRKNFQGYLQTEGLELEISAKKSSNILDKIKVRNIFAKCCAKPQRKQDKKTYYVKVHAPWDVLAKYAEITNMKMPIAQNDMIGKFETCWSKCPTPFDHKGVLPDIPDYFTAPFSRARIDKFIFDDKDTFFSPAQRSLLTYQILSRAVLEDLGDPAKNKFGIKNMLNNGAYDAAFPLHEGEYTSEHSLLTRGPENQRHLLYETWAKPGAWYKFQPLDHIRLYFGEKISIYFTWLGYYTGLLIPAGLVGLAIFIYGCARMPFNEASNDICSDSGPGNFTMCPLCDDRCEYWRLKTSCIYSRVTYLFDNEATVAFAAFMALWSTVFHEMWKRRAAEIEYDWDVADFEEEETIRPEYEASVRRKKVNPVTKAEEPRLRFTSRVLRIFSSLWVVLFMLCIVLAAVFGVIVYRMTVSAILYAVDQQTIKQRAGIITSITASVINLIIIILLGKVYQFIAQMLTNFETHRTLTEWEDSFTLKMFLFQFVNHFASLFYIAFFKGRLVGRPGQYNRDINNSRQEECDPSGCFIELCIQLAIIMVGKQAFNNFKEVILPKVMNWIKSRKMKEIEKKKHEKVSQWEKDYAMDTMPDLGLFDEYLEMVIQYGFVTIFVAAFPLAPLFALINNVVEIRLDAYKFVTQWRRPLAMRAQDIGIWFGILQGISKVAVLSNAVIIAFTSEFVPKLVYQYVYSSNQNLDGYLNFSLSIFNVSDFEEESVPSSYDFKEFGNVTHCRYRDYRSSESPYDFTLQYWHILSIRLAFILVFVLFVWILSWLIGYMVPDMPRAVKLQILREKYLARESVLETNSLNKHMSIPSRHSDYENGTTKNGVRERNIDKSHPLY